MKWALLKDSYSWLLKWLCFHYRKECLFMKFSYVFKHLDASDSAVEYAAELFSRLDKQLFKPEQAHITFSSYRNEFCTEVTMKTNDGFFKARGVGDTLYAAIDEASEHLSKQYTRQRKKAKNHKRHYRQQHVQLHPEDFESLAYNLKNKVV